MPTESYHFARNLEELTRQNVETISALETAGRDETASHRLAAAITRFCGSMTFVVVHTLWFGAWIAMNTLLPRALRFDPFPFTFLTLVVSLEAIFLSTFILMAENNQTAADERRARLDLQVNLLSEQENTKMLHILVKLAEKLDVDIAGDPTVAALEQATRPDALLEQIERAAEVTDGARGDRK